MKIIMTKKLYPKLGIVNGSINYKKNIIQKCKMDKKKHYNVSPHKCFDQFQ